MRLTLAELKAGDEFRFWKEHRVNEALGQRVGSDYLYIPKDAIVTQVHARYGYEPVVLVKATSPAIGQPRTPSRVRDLPVGVIFRFPGGEDLWRKVGKYDEVHLVQPIERISDKVRSSVNKNIRVEVAYLHFIPNSQGGSTVNSTQPKDLNNEFNFTASFTVLLKNKHGQWLKGAYSTATDASLQADQEVKFDTEAVAEVHSWPYVAGAQPITVRVGEKRKAQEAAAQQLFGLDSYPEKPWTHFNGEAG